MVETEPPPPRTIRPQPGPQQVFLSSPADIAIYGGSAGGGKTFGLLLEALRHTPNPRFGAVVFRRTYPEITNEGGLWDESSHLYPAVGGVPREHDCEWRFPSGATVAFRHLQHEKDKHAWQGAQIPLIGFDELTHFSQSQFFYLLSRNRSTCGVRPYVRATTNPDAMSWVKSFLAPWLDRDFEGPAASGELRWFVRDGGAIRWVPRDTPDAKSVTFVRASVFDNKILLEKDPGYLANLKALSVVDRARLLDGDWDIVVDGNMFRRHWFEVVREVPRNLEYARFWDLAASEVKPGKDPDYTAGALVGRDRATSTYYLVDVVRLRETPGHVERVVRQTAESDRAKFKSVSIVMEREGGASGITVIEHYRNRVLDGFAFRGEQSTGPKAERAKPLSSKAEAGGVKLLAGAWNHDWINEAVAFPTEGVHDDQIDATSGAFNALARGGPLRRAADPFADDRW